MGCLHEVKLVGGLADQVRMTMLCSGDQFPHMPPYVKVFVDGEAQVYHYKRQDDEEDICVYVRYRDPDA